MAEGRVTQTDLAALVTNPDAKARITQTSLTVLVESTSVTTSAVVTQTYIAALCSVSAETVKRARGFLID